jgi:glycosyltransferase involved in cell wall biosynthesis
MKNIALIRNSYSFDFGGAEIFPINLATEILKSDYSPLVLSANKKTLTASRKEKIKTIKSPWWSWQNFSGFKIFLFPLYLIWQVYLYFWYLRFGIKYKIDIFHPQSRDDFIAVTLAGKTLRKRVVWTDHADLKYIFANHKVWYKNPVSKLVYFASKLADHIMLESFSEKKLVEKALGKALPAKYVVIHIGVVDNYKPTKQSGDKIVFASTSRLVKAKGIGELIEAFKLINNEDAVLKLYGDGPEADYFKSLAGDTKNIEFLGHINDVADALQKADIFVHPSYHECFGLSLVEAEMCSLPIIACNVDSIPEIVKDGASGILVREKNVEELAEAMRLLLRSEKLRKAMGQAGRQIYLESFQFDKIVKDKILPLYA